MAREVMLFGKWYLEHNMVVFILHINLQFEFTIRATFIQSRVKKGSTTSKILIYLNFQKLYLDITYCLC